MYMHTDAHTYAHMHRHTHSNEMTFYKIVYSAPLKTAKATKNKDLRTEKLSRDCPSLKCGSFGIREQDAKIKHLDKVLMSVILSKYWPIN